MAITNEPIMLNETGVLIKDALERQNGYLAILAEGKRSEIYSSISQIAGIVRGNNLDTNKRIFPIGDQIIVPWKDKDDETHNTDETAYKVEWDIVHHGMVTLQDGSVVPGMYLMMHRTSVYGVQFDHPQAFYQAKEELPTGTYHVNFGVAYNDPFMAGTSGQFTLTSSVPIGGRLWFSGSDVQVFTSAESGDVAETVAMTIGKGGMELGTISSVTKISDTGLNAMHRIQYGSNRWSTSALRQYLNSSGTNWFASKEDFGIRPDQFDKHGFMSGFNGDFLDAIKPVKVTTVLNQVEGLAETTEDTFDTFFLPSLEQINAAPEHLGAEGDTFEYWRRRLGLSGFAEKYPATHDGYKIPAINSQSPQLVRLRSASDSMLYNVWNIYPQGNVRLAGVSHKFSFTPVCVVC